MRGRKWSLLKKLMRNRKCSWSQLNKSMYNGELIYLTHKTLWKKNNGKKWNKMEMYTMRCCSVLKTEIQRSQLRLYKETAQLFPEGYSIFNVIIYLWITCFYCNQIIFMNNMFFHKLEITSRILIHAKLIAMKTKFNIIWKQ